MEGFHSFKITSSLDAKFVKEIVYFNKHHKKYIVAVSYVDVRCVEITPLFSPPTTHVWIWDLCNSMPNYMIWDTFPKLA